MSDEDGLTGCLEPRRFLDEPTDTIDLPSLPRPLAGVEIIDRKGDVVLAARGVRLLVCSRILELSCPFFEKFFHPDAFAEGKERPNSDHPPVKQLDEENPDALRLMCRMLHFIPEKAPESIEEYRVLVDTCDFYGYGEVLPDHVRKWLELWESPQLTISQLQSLLIVAFVFRLCGHFQRLSRVLAETATTDDWLSWDSYPIPQAFIGE